MHQDLFLGKEQLYCNDSYELVELKCLDNNQRCVICCELVRGLEDRRKKIFLSYFQYTEDTESLKTHLHMSL